MIKIKSLSLDPSDRIVGLVEYSTLTLAHAWIFTLTCYNVLFIFKAKRIIYSSSANWQICKGKNLVGWINTCDMAVRKTNVPTWFMLILALIPTGKF